MPNIVEVDVIGLAHSGEQMFLGVFRVEVPDNFFGENWMPVRWSFPEIRSNMQDGALFFRPAIRPKNTRVVEGEEEEK